MRHWLLRLGIVVVLVLTIAGLAYLLTRPPNLPATVKQIPAPTQEETLAGLAASGYTPLSAPVWAGTKDVWQAPGRYRLFFAASVPGGEADIYVAELSTDRQGHLSAAPRVRNMTNTSAGAEIAPIASGGWLAFATRVGSRYQSVTMISLADPEQPLVFAFAQPASEVELTWQPSSGTTRLAITTGQDVVALDPATRQTEPNSGALQYLPVVKGEQAWLPNLVSRVRELPFVGPEKIAFLENVFFSVEDRVTRLLHGSGAAPIASAPVAARNGEPTPNAAPIESATALPTGAGDTPTSSPSVTAMILASPTAAPSPTSGEVATAAPPTEQPAALAQSPTAKPPTAVVSPTAAEPATEPPTQPAPELPTAAPTGSAGSLAYGVQRRSTVRPDPQRAYAEVELLDIDPSLLQIKMVPGTWEPRPTTGLVGSGVIPMADWANLVAAFNGGFAAMHGAYGMMVDRKVYLPARSGIATLAVYEDGSMRMGTWGKDLVETPDMVSYRQNCPPLIENGMITAETGKLTLWGLSVSNELYLYRSGLGVTADNHLVYAAGKHLSAYTLARALQSAGAVYAMQLDVDEFHVAFMTYNVQPAQAGSEPVVTGHKLRDDMRGFDGLFLRPFQLDFFYLLKRAQPLTAAVRTGQAAESAGTASGSEAAVDLPGQLAFASNRDGNWELYAMKPGQSTTMRRLTTDPADDLYPSWSPDGRRLAFSSRRDGNSEIYVLDAASLATQRLTNQSTEEWAPAWSPDGTRLAYQSDRNAQSEVFVSRLDGSGETRLTPEQGNHEAPHWSPDGNRIVFDSDLDVQEAVHASINVYIMNADGSNPWRLYTHGESPSWSPDGRQIAFTGLRSGRWQVCLINVDGSGYHQLTTGEYDARYPVWSPDGRWLAFAGNRGGHWELYVMPAGGAGQPGVTYPLRVTFSGNADSSYPAWGVEPKSD